ncbi:MAG: sulfatase [Aureliella sp.]
MSRFISQVLLAAAAFIGLEPALLAADQPNILLFMADDMTYSDIGCYGNHDVHTPNLDRLATESLRMTRCFNSAPMCSPLRQSLYTGLYPVRNGAYPNHSRVYDGTKSLPHYLNSAGYRAALIGKRHEAPESAFPFEFLGGRHHDNGKGLDLDLQRVDAFLGEAAKSDQPFCLVVTSNQPHRPWNRGDVSAYDPDKLTVPPNLIDTPETRVALCNYYAEITYMDAQLGSCLDSLDRHSLRDNTLVIFLSEQGSNFPFCKWTCYPAGIQSACIVRWPGTVQPHSTSDALISYVDIVPTILDAARIDIAQISSKEKSTDAKKFDGQSFMPVLRSTTAKGSPFVFALQTSRGIFAGPEAYAIRAVTDGEYLLIWNIHHNQQFANTVTKRDTVYQSWDAAGKAGNAHSATRHKAYRKRPEWELYRVSEDPWNLRNLAEQASMSPKMSSLRAELASWMQEQGDLGDETERAALSRQVKRDNK